MGRRIPSPLFLQLDGAIRFGGSPCFFIGLCSLREMGFVVMGKEQVRLTAYISEMDAGTLPDIPLTDVDLAALTAGDESPMFVTIDWGILLPQALPGRGGRGVVRETIAMDDLPGSTERISQTTILRQPMGRPTPLRFNICRCTPRSRTPTCQSRSLTMSLARPAW